MSDSTAICCCSSCGRSIESEHRIDVGHDLPYPLLDLPDHCVRRLAKGMAHADGVGSFVRCMLPVTLSGELELVLGVWIQVSDSDYARCWEVWDDDDAYLELTLHGTLANRVHPWVEAFGADVTITVDDPGNLPNIVDSSHPLASRMLNEVWDRDEVLTCFEMALPVAVRERLTHGWSIERTAGLKVTVDDRTLRFTGEARSVSVDIFGDRTPRPAAEMLRDLLADAPEAPAGQQFTHDDGTELRNAFWRTVPVEGGVEYQFYGQVVRDGSTFWLVCTHTRPEDHEWALHVFRSIERRV